MRPAGLAGRLILSATLAACVVMLAGGWALHAALRDSMRDTFDQRLGQRAEILLARFEASPGAARPIYVEPRIDDAFERIFSGWYWRLRGDGFVLRSRSLWDGQVTQIRELGQQRISAIGPAGKPVFGIARTLELGGSDYRLQVFGPAQPLRQELQDFDRLLVWILLALLILLVAASVLQARFSLRPLARLRAAMVAVQRGNQNQIGRGYGTELEPLATELDALLARNARIVTRARGHAADLAHALKKPLALLRSEADHGQGVPATLVRREVATMARLIDRHLARAGSGAGDRRHIDVAASLTALLELMRQLHAERSLQWHADVAAELSWRGEATDLDEMLGNLLDNAGKWAATEVRVTASREGDQLRVRVDDDGPGLTPEQREQAAQRWQRFDESTHGNGLGLAITADIAATYEGDLQLAAGPLGGLRVLLTLPG